MGGGLHAGQPVHTTPQAPISVIGPGTGLGVALLVGDEHAGWRVVETEGGHATFAPLGDEEQRIARFVDARHGRTSNERLLSGPGLSSIDQVLAADGGPAADGAPPRAPAAIVQGALEGHDLVARRALARFCAVLGSFDVGKEADLTVVDYGALLPYRKSSRGTVDLSPEDVLSLCIHRGGPEAVVETFVRGQSVYRAPEPELF